jgi:hypothetical protein
LDIDAETKLVPAYRVGKRSWTDATIFMKDLSSRMANRAQLSTDGLAAYDAAYGGGSWEEPVEPAGFGWTFVYIDRMRTMANHAFQIDVRHGHEVQCYWVIAPNGGTAMYEFKKMPGLAAVARLDAKGQIPDRVALELGLDLTAVGTYGRLDGHSN